MEPWKYSYDEDHVSLSTTRARTPESIDGRSNSFASAGQPFGAENLHDLLCHVLPIGSLESIEDSDPEAGTHNTFHPLEI